MKENWIFYEVVKSTNDAHNTPSSPSLRALESSLRALELDRKCMYEMQFCFNQIVQYDHMNEYTIN